MKRRLPCAVVALGIALCSQNAFAGRTNRLESRPCGPSKGNADIDIQIELTAVPSDARIRFSIDRSNSSLAFQPKEGHAELCLRNPRSGQHRLRAELLAQGGLALYWAGTFDSGPYAGEDYTFAYDVPFVSMNNTITLAIDERIRPVREVLSPSNAEEARAASPSSEGDEIATDTAHGTPTEEAVNQPAAVANSGATRFAEPGPCDERDGTGFSYSLGPLTLAIGTNGHLQVRFPNAEISTPIGTFGIGGGSSLYHDGASCTLIVRWGETEQLYKFGGSFEVVLAGVGQGMPDGATLRISKNERSRDSILVEISGRPGNAYYRRLLSEPVWFVHQVEFDRPGWLRVRVKGHSIFSIEMAVEQVSADNTTARCRVVRMRRYWEGNWGTTGIRENDILSLPLVDDRDSDVTWDAPIEFGGAVRKNAAYWLPTDKLQSNPPF